MIKTYKNIIIILAGLILINIIANIGHSLQGRPVYTIAFINIEVTKKHTDIKLARLHGDYLNYFYEELRTDINNK